MFVVLLTMLFPEAEQGWHSWQTSGGRGRVRRGKVAVGGKARKLRGGGGGG